MCKWDLKWGHLHPTLLCYNFYHMWSTTLNHMIEFIVLQLPRCGIARVDMQDPIWTSKWSTVVLLWESCLGNIDTNTQKIARRVPLVVQREEVSPCTFLCNYDKPPFPNFNHYTWQHGWPMSNGETFNWCFMGILAFVAHMLFSWVTEK
jgi:hypothetical protein